MSFIPIQNTQKELFKSGTTGNFSLYFPRMVSWNDDEGEKMKDKDCIVELGKASISRYSGAEEALKSIHKKQSGFLFNRNDLKLQVFEFRAKLSTPFISGLGSGHPTETGMILDRNTGLPFIPASGIKGALRLAHALNLAESNPDLVRQNPKGEYEISDSEPSLIKYFGSTDAHNSVRGQLVFLDAFPATIPTLKTDIMNPHFGKYYNGEQAPLETESPIPIKFLSVKEGTEFVFRCVVSPLENPSKRDEILRSFDNTDVVAITKMFERALQELGLGAKTAVGYGRFVGVKEVLAESLAQKKLEEEAQKKAEFELKQKQIEEERLAQLTPDEREKEKYQNSKDTNSLISKSLENSELTKDFFVWLRQLLQDKKQWKIDGNPAKDKTVKRCLNIEAKLK